MCNIGDIFTEILKDEINANDQQKLYNGVKRLIKKYSQEKRGLEPRWVCKGFNRGASLEELLQIAREESQNPTITTEIIVDDSCHKNGEIPAT